MASTGTQNQHEARERQNLSTLQKMAYDIKFDLSNTDYIPNMKIGSGAYGVVCSATHKKTKEKVAIKKTQNVFAHMDLAMRTYRELKILRHFKHDNIISIREILKPPTPDFKDVYIVLDLMESDLHQVIHTNDPLSDQHVRYILYQILRGLKYIHSANVIHRDLKPSNLLINSNCELKIGDFGMARGISSCPDEQSNNFMTQYVATRYYRAPELIMYHKKYSTAVDLWSVGCIFAEMLGRKPLFPGKNYLDQLNIITTTLGTPSKEFLNKTTVDHIRDFVSGLGQSKPISLRNLYPKAPKKAIDMITKMLEFAPVNRITVEQAIKHPYLNEYHDPNDEPVCKPVFNFDFEKELKNGNDIREAMKKEIEDMHRPFHNLPTLNLQVVPIEGKSSPLSSAGSSSLISRTENVIRELKELAKDQMTKPHTPQKDIPNEAQFSKNYKQGEDAQTVPEIKTENNPSINVDTSKVSDDVEMLSAKTAGLKIADETIKSEFEENIKHEGVSVQVDAAKKVDDVEMLSAKAENLKIYHEKVKSETRENALSVDATKKTDDVEMLSAKTAELKIMNELGKEPHASTNDALSVTTTEQVSTNLIRSIAGQKDNMGPLAAVNDDSDKNTADEKPVDTKALIKALLKGKRSKSMSENIENAKPKITALQRQKEREDKRKKKQERALQKKKKNQEPKEGVQLSDADLQLLERWKNMQHVTKTKKDQMTHQDKVKSSQRASWPSTSSQVSQSHIISTTVTHPHMTPSLIPAQTAIPAQSVNPAHNIISAQDLISNQLFNITGQDNHNMVPNAASCLTSNLQPKGNVPNASLIQRHHITNKHTRSDKTQNFAQLTGLPPEFHALNQNMHAHQRDSIHVNSLQGNTFSNPSMPTQISSQLLNIHQARVRPAQMGDKGNSNQINAHHPKVDRVQVLAANYEPQTGPPPLIHDRTLPIPSIQSEITGNNFGLNTIAGDPQNNSWQEKYLGLEESEQPKSQTVWPTTSEPTVITTSGYDLDIEGADQTSVTLPQGWLGTQNPYSQNETLPSYTDAIKNNTNEVLRRHSSGENPQSMVPIRRDSLPDLTVNTHASYQPKASTSKDQVGGVTLSQSFHKSPLILPYYETISPPTPVPESHQFPQTKNTGSNRLSPGYLNIPPLTRVLPRSQLEELHTPKGTGNGYGVGLDLDLLLRESLPMEFAEGDRNSEADPLSATLLADWQEAIGNSMNPRDIEALTREVEMGLSSPTTYSMSAEGS